MNAPSGPSTAAGRVREVCADAVATLGSGRAGAEVAALAGRLEGPLRVALAGRVKAGKSTLLNALVGERLAATDAGECTRVVTWYQEGLAYDVTAQCRDGRRVQVPFGRVDGALHVDLAGLAPDEVERLVVSWPSAMLRDITLVDTPGLASLDEANSLRTTEFLAFGQGRPTDVDAVVYLMRHLHRRDAEFLGAFLDRSVAAASPVNAVAVLSRADEIGAGRLDALASAGRIAERYRSTPEVQALCSAVVPVAGLVAETGQTFREDEAAALRTLAATAPDVLDRMLLAVDTFCEPGSSDLTVELRRTLLERLGLFGVRFCVDEVRTGRATTAVALARALVAASGLESLRRLLAEHFIPRAQTLKARAVLAGLRDVARRLEADDPVAAAHLAGAVERCEASTPEFAELRLVHLTLTGAVPFTADEVAEVARVTARPSSVATRLGVAGGTDASSLAALVLAAVERWRTRAGDPLAAPSTVEACETVAHAYEAMYLELTAPPPP